MNDQVVACLMHGIYEKHGNGTGYMDRRECSVCHGDRCPLIVDEAQHGACPQCFGTGMAPVAIFDLQNRTESLCGHCQGTGRV